MKPGGIGRFTPPAPVYQPCVLCGRKHRMRPNGTTKTGYVPSLSGKSVVMNTAGEYVRVPAGAVICFTCQPFGASVDFT